MRVDAELRRPGVEVDDDVGAAPARARPLRWDPQALADDDRLRRVQWFSAAIAAMVVAVAAAIEVSVSPTRTT